VPHSWRRQCEQRLLFIKACKLVAAVKSELANVTEIARHQPRAATYEAYVSQWTATIDFKRGFLALLLHAAWVLRLPSNNADESEILHLGNLIRDVVEWAKNSGASPRRRLSRFGAVSVKWLCSAPSRRMTSRYIDSMIRLSNHSVRGDQHQAISRDLRGHRLASLPLPHYQIKLVLDLANPEGCKAELTWLAGQWLPLPPPMC